MRSCLRRLITPNPVPPAVKRKEYNPLPGQVFAHMVRPGMAVRVWPGAVAGVPTASVDAIVADVRPQFIVLRTNAGYGFTVRIADLESLAVRLYRI